MEIISTHVSLIPVIIAFIFAVMGTIAIVSVTNKVPQRIKELREALKLSQEDFGKRIGLSPREENYIERRGILIYRSYRYNFQFEAVFLMYAVFNANVNYLLYGAGGRFSSKFPVAEDRAIAAISLLHLRDPKSVINAGIKISTSGIISPDTPLDKVLSVINVNEQWLKTGKGVMIKETDGETI